MKLPPMFHNNKIIKKRDNNELKLNKYLECTCGVEMTANAIVAI